jgi:SpoVK/Ycf46/Vps4 family AAA+-type ATPase
LSASFNKVKTAVDKVLPRHKLPTALEEAEFEDEIGDDLEKHSMIQCELAAAIEMWKIRLLTPVEALDKMRTFRPRLLIHGPSGMGQTYLGPAILHHLEGFHVQSLDLGTLMGDTASVRTFSARSAL